MERLIQEDLSLALALLQENMIARAPSASFGSEGLRILCREEKAFTVSLLLDASPCPLPEQQPWERVTMENAQLRIRTKDEEYTVSYLCARCEICLHDYTHAPLAFAPHHYLRDRIEDSLYALKEKHRLLPHTLREKEKALLPLCEQSLFSKEVLSPKAQELLSPLGIHRLPLQEDEKALALLGLLQEAAPREENDAQELLQRTFENGRFCFLPKKSLISVGLRTHLCKNLRLYCHLRAASYKERILLECAITPKATLSSPEEAAEDLPVLQDFHLFDFPREEFTSDLLLRLRSEIEALSFSRFSSLKRRPGGGVAPAFLLSSLLWAAITHLFFSLLCAVFPVLLPLRPLAPLPAFVYGALRWLLYRFSAKL